MPAAITLTAQKRIAPTAEQIERFSRTTTNVVLTGSNMLVEAALREALEKQWKITPLKFIDKAEFEATMSDANSSFLLMIGGTFEKDSEPNNYTYLNLVMGGNVAFDQLAEFILLPISCEGQPDDKPVAYMAAFVDIIQRHVKRVQEKPKTVKQELDTYNDNLPRLRTRTLIIAKEDIAYDVTEEALTEQFNNKIEIVDGDAVLDAMDGQAFNKIAGLTLYPRVGSEKGTYCYNMLIACDTHELIYFKRHKITGKKQQGFLKEEIKRMGIQARKK